MSKISDTVSAKLRTMGLFCAFLVIFIHIDIRADARGPWIVHDYFSLGLGKIAVPFFFAAAGYLLAGHINEIGWYRQAVVKRIRSLLLPLLLWCILSYIYTNLLAAGCNLSKGLPLLDGITVPTMHEFARILAIEPFSQPYLRELWFVRALFFLVLFSPILVKIAHPLTVAGLLILHGLIHPDYGVPCTPFIFTVQEGFFSLFGMTYFTAGILLRKKEYNLILNWKIGLPLLVLGLLLLGFRGEPYHNLLARQLTWAYTPLLLTGVWWLCPAVQLPSWLRNASFPVYALHKFALATLVVVAHQTGLHWLTGRSCTTAGYIAFGVLTFVLCVFVAKLMRRFLPSAATILFGGR